MTVSVFDLFSIGIGPSSSHTVGPMRAARRFLEDIDALGRLQDVESVRVEVYGSLALTGRGHGTDKAVLMGLCGEKPAEIDPAQVPEKMDAIYRDQRINLLGKKTVKFVEKDHLIFNFKELLPKHANGMHYFAYDAQGELIHQEIFYSIGGGFIVRDKEYGTCDSLVPDHSTVPYPFKTGAQLLAHCERQNMSIAEIMMENEKTWRSEADIKKGLMNIWDVMKKSIERGCQTTGILPGGLNVRRRAAVIVEKLKASPKAGDTLNWVNAFAIAVNEENAAGGRVVTAPTNGAAGIIPAVFQYHVKFTPGATEEDAVPYLLTAGAMGILFKEGASISAAEVGCQGEVGVACSMAAAGLCALLGGTVMQVENAAEIGMEHHLGLTCDPIKGLVQIPCIERNAMGSLQAINSAELALMGDGEHIVSLDAVIATLMQTGRDMQSKYKETALGGLAVNVQHIGVNMTSC